MKVYYTQPRYKVYPNKSRLVNANFSSKVGGSKFGKNIYNWIESNNSFYFQLIGIFILTAGMILSLQNFLDGTKLNASAKENSEIRLLTNFKQSPKLNLSTGKLQEVVTPLSSEPETAIAEKKL